MASPTCTNVRIPVTLGDSSSVQIAGRLCVPVGATCVQLLLHGITYAKFYWDLPFQPEHYSYVVAANRAGYATLNIDRLGAGESPHPLSALVTLESHVSVVHQIVQKLRSGAVGGTAFKKVVLIGHSYGALISFAVAGRFQDVDAMVPTGASHQMNTVSVLTRLIPATEPATLDPKFASSGLDTGYLTTRLGTRVVFHNAHNTDPAVIALDEQLKETVTAAELISSIPASILDPSRQINIPVLAVNGTDEPFFCNGLLSGDCSSAAALVASERPFYGPGVTLDALVVPDAGHDVTLARSAPKTLAAVQEWLSDHVPPS